MSDKKILKAHLKELYELRAAQLADYLEISEAMAIDYIFVDMLLRKKNGTL